MYTLTPGEGLKAAQGSYVGWGWVGGGLSWKFTIKARMPFYWFPQLAGDVGEI